MKTLAPLAVLAFFAISFTSCRKDYNCKCTYGTGKTTVTYTKTISNAKRNSAVAECKAFETANAPGGVTTPATCKIY